MPVSFWIASIVLIYFLANQIGRNTGKRLLRRKSSHFPFGDIRKIQHDSFLQRSVRFVAYSTNTFKKFQAHCEIISSFFSIKNSEIFARQTVLWIFLENIFIFYFFLLHLNHSKLLDLTNSWLGAQHILVKMILNQMFKSKFDNLVEIIASNGKQQTFH